ncbi:MAG: hypothetical protein ACR2JB_07795, partial [Bryobacteraceae bacterium]
ADRSPRNGEPVCLARIAVVRFQHERAPMKIDEILAALRDERQQLDEVILSLERIDHAKGQLKKLGRPPGTKNKPKVLSVAV